MLGKSRIRCGEGRVFGGQLARSRNWASPYLAPRGGSGIELSYALPQGRAGSPRNRGSARRGDSTRSPGDAVNGIRRAGRSIGTSPSSGHQKGPCNSYLRGPFVHPPCRIRLNGAMLQTGLYGVLHTLVPPVAKAVWRPEVTGLEHLPATGGVILASNHLSFADSVVVPIVVPRKVVYLAKKDYFTGTGISGAATRAWFEAMDMLPVDRDDTRAAIESLDTALEVLAPRRRLRDLPGGHPLPGRPAVPRSHRRRAPRAHRRGARRTGRAAGHGAAPAGRGQAAAAGQGPDRARRAPGLHRATTTGCRSGARDARSPTGS